MLGSSIPVFLSFYHQTISHTIFCVRQWLEFAFQDLHKYYTFSKRALTTVSTRAIIISQTLGIWHRAVKLLVVFHKYWLEVLEGNHSSSSLKIFVEPKAIYFRRCFYTVISDHNLEKKLTSFPYGYISRFFWIYWQALLHVNYHQ